LHQAGCGARAVRWPHRRIGRPGTRARTRTARLCVAVGSQGAGGGGRMSALLESLAQGFAGDAAERATLEAVLREGLPRPRSEAWKYTSLRALERRVFAPATGVEIDAAVLAGIDGPRLVFVNGAYSAALSRVEGLPSGVTVSPSVASEATAVVAHPDAVFAGINAAMARSGATLRIAPGTRVDTPVHLVLVGAPAPQDQAWHLRHAIEVGEGASARIVEHHVAAGEHAHLSTSFATVVLERGAHLAHLCVQDDAPGATRFARTQSRVHDDARYARLDLELGGALSRHEFGCALLGAGASVQ